MPEYKVKQGDYLSKIAKQHGFPDHLTIWDHSNNKELRNKRKNPNVLYPGDVLFIPEKEKKVESGETEQRHHFKLKGKPLMLRIVLKDYNDKPIANVEVDLHLDGNVYPLTTDSKGKIEKEIPSTANEGKLVFTDPDTPFDEMVLKIGYLDPIEEVSGWKARLNNLGYNAGPIDDEKTEQLRSAIEEFQCDYFKDLSQVDGECGPKTQAKLKEVHGC